MNPLQHTKFVNLTPPAAIVDDASFTVAELDTKDWDYCTLVCIHGATDVAFTAMKVTESDTAGSGHADVTGLVMGTSNNIAGSASALPAATDDDKIQLFEIDLRYRKRYLDMTITIGNGTVGGFLAVIAILSRAKDAPVTAAERGCDEILRV